MLYSYIQKKYLLFLRLSRTRSQLTAVCMPGFTNWQFEERARRRSKWTNATIITPCPAGTASIFSSFTSRCKISHLCKSSKTSTMITKNPDEMISWPRAEICRGCICIKHWTKTNCMLAFVCCDRNTNRVEKQCQRDTFAPTFFFPKLRTEKNRKLCIRVVSVAGAKSYPG